MRAVVVGRHGGPPVLVCGERPEPRPTATEVLVRVLAAGVNFIDTYHRSGYYPTTLPFTPGVEGVGVVLEAGSEAAGEFAPGDRVGWVMGRGSYAERVALPMARVVPIPETVGSELAAASLLQGVTAHYLTNDTYAVRPGDTVLVHAAAGGMGLLLTQMSKLKGARVIGTVSTARKEWLAARFGADEVIRYNGKDFSAEVRRLTDGRGVAVVYDGVGEATFDGSLACLRRHGVLAQYGQASGPVPPFDLKRLADGGSLYLTRPAFANHIADRAELRRRVGAVLELISFGQLTIHIGGRYPLSGARAAHENLEARRTVGKLLLLPTWET
ncbi:MAG: zinc-binding dehydrogenase [Micromonosporaceae bacterium]|nr:zinc-binding dehydrogenase [Micromonosporaceae bacterium]